MMTETAAIEAESENTFFFLDVCRGAIWSPVTGRSELLFGL